VSRLQMIIYSHAKYNRNILSISSLFFDPFRQIQLNFMSSDK